MGNKVVMMAKRRHSLYYLDAQILIGHSDASQVDETMKWHSRLGHIDERALNELKRQKILSNPTSFKINHYEICLLGKSTKLPFPKGKHVSNMPLDYAHADLWGPSNTPIMGGARYFLSIIDDCSRLVWIYLLKQKSDAFKYFQRWCA
ncbi:uncharacterized mitochondrial protein AtMg00300-like [Salvia miltiorrhiza]|uniref:uncharacterized mitochondrial protein AtMg00300-like n=1 Tax=Salvia miltiorrhiza TaxID=226208 RepID=UPI0025ABEBAF|nr:uncharacterized mitochondrial protein AtMg00300-like [Salvia miltiorrhiza]